MLPVSCRKVSLLLAPSLMPPRGHGVLSYCFVLLSPCGQDHVNRLRKKLGKDMLRGVVGPPPTGYSKMFGRGSRHAEVGKGV